MPNLIRQRRVNEVQEKPGGMVQNPCNGWVYFPGLYRVTQVSDILRTRSGTPQSCKNTDLTGI
jgi:hypothetical protein